MSAAIRHVCVGLCVLIYAAAATPPPGVRALAPGVTVVTGPINGVLFERAGHTLAVYGDPRPKPANAEFVLFTHHRRDVVWAGKALVRGGAEAAVPAGETALFTGVNEFWERFRTARFHDYGQQTTKVLAEPIEKVKPVRGGERIVWRGLSIEVLETPGYTRHAVSYLVEAGGKRIACTGDLIYGDGRIFDLYSLQDAIPEAKEDAYHGYAARAAELIASLREVARWKPDLLVPARGPVIERPQEAIDRLIERLQAVFRSHFEIAAQRWYRGDQNLRLQAARVLGNAAIGWMPTAETVKPLPDWILLISNSRLIVSRSGAAFLVDCGSRQILEDVRKLREGGRFQTLEGVWVTHYHDDHTDQLQAVADEFHCPVLACPQMRDILEHPAAYRMPAVTADPVREVKVISDGTKLRWHEFQFTYSYFPGQTLYHGGLLVERDCGGTVLFVGDSFMPTGIDDYCLLNRNFVEPEQGYAYCLNLLKGLKPECLLINQHVKPSFRFSPRQIDFMIDNWRKRRESFRVLFPWHDANYGLDEQWAHFYPYGIDVRAGRPFGLQLRILNHSSERQTYRITPHAPDGWQSPQRPLTVSVRPHQEGFVSIPLTAPRVGRGLAIVTADIAFGPWDLRRWAEAMVMVE